MRLFHILVEAKWQAEKILEQLKAGGSFEILAMKHSTCSSAAKGGDLGFVRLEKLNGDFAEAAEALKPGELSGLVRTRHGYHILLRGEK